MKAPTLAVVLLAVVGSVTVYAAGRHHEKKTVPVVLSMTGKQLKLSVGGEVPALIPLVRDLEGNIVLDDLKGRFKQIRTTWPDQHGLTLRADESVRYEDLVQVIDEAIEDGLAEIQVKPENA